MRELSPARTISWCSASWASATRPQDGLRAAAQLRESRGRAVNAPGQLPAAPLERATGGLDLEGGAQLRQPAHVVRRQARDAGPAVGRDLHEPLALQGAQRGAQGVAGHVVLARQGLLSQRRTGSKVAVEDAAAQRLGQSVDGGEPGERAGLLRAHSIRPWRMPMATACVRVEASSLARIRFVWVRTVSVERPSFSATASVCMPSASI